MFTSERKIFGCGPDYKRWIHEKKGGIRLVTIKSERDQFIDHVAVSGSGQRIGSFIDSLGIVALGLLVLVVSKDKLSGPCCPAEASSRRSR